MLRGISTALLLVAAAGAARADQLVLANGDRLNGEVVEWAVDHVVLDHPQLGRVRISLGQLALDTGEAPRRGLFDTGLLRGWERHLDLGVNGNEGNSTATNVTVGLDLGYEDEFKRWKLAGRYFYNRSDDGNNDNDGRIELRRDWLVPGRPLFFFSKARYEYDQFESWRHRTSLSVGPGYQLLRREHHTLDGLLGATFTRDYAGAKENRGESLLQLDYVWRIAENHSLALSNALFTAIHPSAGQLRNVTSGEWRIRLAAETGFSLKIGAENEFETDVEPGDEKNDLKYYLALGLDF